MHLELCDCIFNASPNTVTIRIPLAIWECIRSGTIARSELSELSDTQLDQVVRDKWAARQKQLEGAGETSPLRLLGALVWGCGSSEEQLATGLEWYRRERDRQRDLQKELELMERENGRSTPMLKYSGRMHVSSVDRGGPLLLDLPNAPAIEELVSSGDYDVEIVVRQRPNSA